MRTKAGVEMARGMKMMALGFQPYHTGGGCMAWLHELGGGRAVLVTDRDSGIPEHADDPIYVGYESGDGDFVEAHEMDSIDEFIEIWS